MTSEGLLREFRDTHVSTVYAAPGTPERQRVFDEAVQSGGLRHLTGKFWSVVPQPTTARGPALSTQHPALSTQH